MAKEITGMLKLQIQAGKANPAPPVGPALGQKGVNIMDFCKQFNDKTKDKMGKVIPVVITVYKDKSFTFVTKQPPTSFLIREKLKIKKGARTPGRSKIATLSKAQVEEIAKEKMEDLNAHDLEQAVKIVSGQARSMGIDVKSQNIARCGINTYNNIYITKEHITMMISWKTDGSAGAVDTVRNWLEEGSNHSDYITWAESNGRLNYSWDIVGDDIVITEEWNIDRSDYDALDIEPVSSAGLPMVETTEHLSF